MVEQLGISFVKLMAGLSTLVTLSGRPEIWMLCTILKYVFLAFLDEPTNALPPLSLLSPLAEPLAFLQLAS